MILRRALPIRSSSQLLVLAALLACHPVLALYEVPNVTYAAPGNYYNTATGLGDTLRGNLKSIISSGFTGTSYDASRQILAITDADPNNANNVLTVYDRTSVKGLWDGGDTWNREHIWPQSDLGVDAGGTNMASDLFNLRPALPGTNSTRGNSYYGTATSTGTSWFEGGNFFFTGNADRGDVARTAFYMSTRYWTNSSNAPSSSNLLLVSTNNGDTVTVGQFGNLAALLQWHYRDGVDNFERRKNDQIYDNYQHNRNPYIDRPELVWAVFGGATNDSQLSVGAAAPDGSSAANLSLGRVLLNSTSGFGTTNATLTKLGNNPTTFDATVSGNATITVPGTRNADTNIYAGAGQVIDYGSGNRQITVGLNALTTSTGLKTGTVTIDNTDITAAAAVGRGSGDGNDILTISAAVVAKRTITRNATSFAFGSVILGAPLSAAINLTTTGDDNNATRVNVGGMAAADANGISISGAAAAFTSSTATSTHTLGGTFAAAGTHSGSLSLNVVSAENGGTGLPGEGAYAPLAFTYSGTALAHAAPSFSPSTYVDTLTLDFGTLSVNSGVASLPFSLSNLVTAPAFTAALDFDSFNSTGSPGLTTNLAPFSNVLAGSTNGFSAFLDTSTAGSFSSQFTLHFSDQDLPGATALSSLTLNLFGIVQGGLVHNGPGTLVLGPAYTTTVASAINGGAVQVVGTGNSFTTISGAGALIIEADAVATANALSVHSLTANGALSIRPGGASTSKVSSLAIAGSSNSWTGSLDLADNALIVQQDAPAVATKAVLANQILFAKNNAWSGPGITSGTVAADLTGKTTLVLADNADLGLTAFHGLPVDAHSLLITRALLGDGNLDDAVDLADFDLWLAHVSLEESYSVAAGDFDLSGVVDLSDFDVWLNHVGNAGLPLAPAAWAAAAVPEPASLALLSIAAAPLLRRRRR